MSHPPHADGAPLPEKVEAHESGPQYPPPPLGLFVSAEQHGRSGDVGGGEGGAHWQMASLVLLSVCVQVME